MKLWQNWCLNQNAVEFVKLGNGRFLDTRLGKVVNTGKDTLIVISLAHDARVEGITLKRESSYDLIHWNRLLLCFPVVTLLHGVKIPSD